jgi:tetratricopeptide (TPR) repeat protein
MSIFDKLLGRNDGTAMVVEAKQVVLRRKEIAAHLRRPDQPNFSDEPQSPCDKCGQPLGEVFITTGGPMGDPDLWLELPVAVDGWACVDCGVFRYPRRVDPATITDLSAEGVAHARAGRFGEAELCFARIVWNWPGYVPGHLNLAEALRERLHHAPPEDAQVKRLLGRRMVEQFEEAIAAFIEQPAPPDAVGSVARACIVVAELAIEERAFDRATRYLDHCRGLEGVPEETASTAAALAEYVGTRGDLFDDAASVLADRIQLSGRAARTPGTPEERALVARAIEDLEEHMRLAPDRWQAAWLRAKALHLLGRDEDAFDAWRQAFDRFGSEPALARDYCFALIEAERTREAREINRAIVERVPDDATLWCNLAVAELLCGDLDAAERALDTSMKIDGSDEIANRLKLRLEQYRKGKPIPRTLDELQQGP